MMHSLPYLHPRRVTPDFAAPLRYGLTALVRKDLDWLDNELECKRGGWLVSDSVTAADAMMGFSVMLIVANGLARDGLEKKWKIVQEWVD